MWSYLKHVGLLLEGVAKTLKALNDLSLNHMVEAKRLLTTQLYGHTMNTITTTHCIPFVTNEKREIAPGILLYVTEGILPMLKVKT